MNDGGRDDNDYDAMMMNLRMAKAKSRKRKNISKDGGQENNSTMTKKSASLANA